jgi:hypothetical protein
LRKQTQEKEAEFEKEWLPIEKM